MDQVELRRGELALIHIDTEATVRIWVTLLQRSVRSHDHLELRVDIIPYARRLYSLPAKTQLNISLLALSLTALTRMSGSGLNRFSDRYTLRSTPQVEHCIPYYHTDFISAGARFIRQ